MVSSVGGSQISSWASSLYSKLDSTNKGYIDKSDLSTAFSKISGSSSSSSASSTDSIFSQLDGNSDGKVTKDEMTTALQQLSDSLDSQYNASRAQGGRGQHGDGPPSPPPDGNGPPPPPPDATSSSGSADSAGFTKDQLTSQLSEIGSSDSKRSELISKIVQNFDKADTDGDGKVSMQEAMAYDKSTKSDSSSTSTASTSTTNSSSSSTSSTDSTTASSQNGELQVMLKMMQLMQAYNVMGQDEKHTGSGIFASA